MTNPSTRQTGQTRVTNSQVANHDSWLVRCSPHAQAFSRSNQRNFVKIETLAQVFSSEFCGISKNTFSTEHLWATASITFPFISGSFLYSLQVTLIKGGVKFELTGSG